MNNRKTQILISLVIFLGVLNLATFFTIGYHIYTTRNDNIEVAEIFNNENTHFNGRYFRDRLNLSSSQMDSFRVINREFRTDARNINIELVSLRRDMLNEMKEDDIDTLKLNAYSKSIGSLHYQLKVSTYDYYLGIKSVCSDEQVDELNLIFEDFFINDLHFGNQGKGHRRGQMKRGQQEN